MSNTRSLSQLYREIGIYRAMMLGVAAFLVYFGLFGGWAALAPIESAALAPGVVVVDSNRRTVQHLEGGIVARLLVREGMEVKEGDPLIRLDETMMRANLDLLRGQMLAAQAAAARLTAERDQTPDIDFSKIPSGDLDDRTKEAIDGQRSIFAARREALASQTRILQQRNLQTREEITGLQAEIKAQDRQIALISEEIDDVRDLLSRGLDRKPRLLALDRQRSEIEGARAQNHSRIARARQLIHENELKIVDLRAAILNDVAVKLREEQARIAEISERLRAAEDVNHRSVIRAPASGRIVGLKVFTTGGVVAPREPLMDIVPKGERLTIEAHVAPADIDVVRPLLTVHLRFVGLNQRTTPILGGRVEQISADRILDQRTGQPHYLARISVPEADLRRSQIELLPGMPVEVAIVTGTRTLIEYLAKPVTDSFSRALREQ